MQPKCYPLTHPQQRVWYTEKLHPGTGMWNNAGTLKLKGKLDVALLDQAIQLFLMQNESIRLRITEENGMPVQYIAAYQPVKLDVLDFTETGVQSLYEWDSIQNQSPMPLLNSNLFYFAIIRLKEDEGGFYTKIHHIISDGLSVVELVNQIVENYQCLLRGKKPPSIQRDTYLSFIQEEREYLQSGRFQKDQQYWMERFRTLPEPTELKPQKNNYHSTKARRKTYVMPSKSVEQLRAYCARRSLSPFSLFLSVLAIYIHRITGKTDLTIGAPVSNRNKKSCSHAIGMFISTVPVRIQLEENLSFDAFSHEVTRDWLSVLKHQRYPYDMLMHELRQQNKDLSALYDISLSYQIGTFKKNTEDFTLEGRWHFSGYQANSLNIHFNDREDSGKLIIDYDYLTPHFSVKEMDYIHTHFLNLLQDAMDHPDKPLYLLDMLSEEERNRVIVQFNQTKCVYPQGKTLAGLWQDRVRESKEDEVALVYHGQTMSVAELDRRSNQLARRLRTNGVDRECIVGLLIPRSEEYCLAVLAVCKAGGAFLPLDPSVPAERLQYMLKDAGVNILLKGRTVSCPVLTESHIMTMSVELPEDADSRALPIVSRPEDLAYVIYTSGSTGQPKGVQIEQHAICHFIYSMGALWGYHEGARMLCAASPSFDLNIMETLPSLVHHCVLVIADEQQGNIPRLMAGLIQEERVNMMMVTPGRMELLLSDGSDASYLKNFREIGLGGDVLPQELLRRVQSGTSARIINFYGPTEITVCATCCDVTSVKEANIGKPMANVKTYILDPHRNPVAINVPGELYIGGAGVARGYINKPELNQERFIPSPFEPGEVLYRSGDLVRWYPMGEIKFLGRIDQQVKIRGYRIELEEIETRLLQIPGIQSCAVTARTDAGGRRYLCAYLCGSSLPAKSMIKEYLCRDLPSYMIPSYFVPMEAIPLNSSSKVDRARLPDPLEMTDVLLCDEYTPPQTQTEQILSEIWCVILQVTSVGREDSFFEIGGDSLSVVQMAAEVTKQFNVEIQLEDVYRTPMLKDCAALIDVAEKKFYRPILPAAAKRYYPVSSVQKRMWVLTVNDPESVAYNVPLAFELPENVDVPRLHDALRKLCQAHEILRTSFQLRKGELFQMVHKTVSLPLVSHCCRPEEVKKVLKDLVQPFVLSAAPLMRAALVEPAPDRRILFLDFHHSICDRQTIDLFLQDLSRLYDGMHLSVRDITYKDYAVWQKEYLQSQGIAQQRDFWKNMMEGDLPLLNLPTDAPRRPDMGSKGARKEFWIERDTTALLRGFAKEHNATPFMVLQAVYQTFLYRYTGQEDCIVGTPVSGRMRPEVQNLSGAFINTLPLRQFPRGDRTFLDFFLEVQNRTIAALEHQDYPLEQLIADGNIVRDSSRNPLFDTMLVQAKKQNSFTLGGFPAKLILFDPGIAKLDLTLEIYEENDSLRCQMEYNTALFTDRTIRRMIDHFCRLLFSLLRSPEQRLRDAEMLSQEESRLVTQEFQQTDGWFAESLPLTCHLEEFARTQREKIAVADGDGSMTFAQLNARANQVARLLYEKNLESDQVVGVCLPRSCDMIAALLGIWKAGAAYLPIDPAMPEERISYMLQDSDVRVLLSETGGPGGYSGEVISLSSLPVDEACGNLDLERVAGPENLAYVIYTSGSTGTPKGTLIKRRGLRNLYEACRTEIGYPPEQVCVCVTTVSFDIFVTDGLFPVLFGCTTVISTEEELRQPHLLAGLLCRWQVRFLQTTPSRMQTMLEDASFRSAASGLLRIVLAGEKIPVPLLRKLRRVTKARILNGYGPTETTVYSSFRDVTRCQKITIGRPLLNTRIYVLDQNQRPLPVGVWGEAYIGGAGLARGYLNREEWTKERFLPDPFRDGELLYRTGDVCRFRPDGELEIAGRVDHQIKLRGLRIELGEIETEWKKLPGILDAAVTVWGEGEQAYLCGYYVSREPYEEKVLRELLGKRLPVYMIPSYFVPLTELPLTVSGKLNRRALPPPVKKETAGNSGAALLTKDEKRMSRIWSRVLGVRQIGPDDNFFELGGDSLAVIKVQAAVLPFGWSIRTQDFYDLQTLRAICSAVVPTCQAPEESKAFSVPRKAPVPSLLDTRTIDFSHVLVTGATGFLGAHLVRELGRMPQVRQVFCLVRPNRGADGRSRLQEVFSFYFGTAEAVSLLRRITVLEGDVSLSRFGMSLPEYEQACLGVTAVLHCAAKTDHIGQPEAFRQSNVEGTRQAVAFARQANASLLHVSTMSVAGRWPAKKDTPAVFTENSYAIGQEVADNVYRASKFAAEGLVFEAVKKGLSARVFRIGTLTGRYEDGAFQLHPEKNAFANRLASLLAIQAAPASMLLQEVEMTPVDLCAHAILTLAQNDAKQVVYHVYHPGKLSGEQLFGYLQDCGETVRMMSDTDFRALTNSLEQHDDLDLLVGIAGDLAQSHPSCLVPVSSKQTQTRLKESGFAWPALDLAYLKRFLKYLPKLRREDGT